MMVIEDPIVEMKDCHREVLKQLSMIEEAALVSSNKTLNLEEFEKAFRKFTGFFEETLVLHTHDEELNLFPALEAKILLQEGLRGNTPVEVMMDDHKEVHAAVRIIQTLIDLGRRGISSKLITGEIRQRVDFTVSTMRDHVWKEDNILYPLAEKILSQKEWEEVAQRMTRYRQDLGFNCPHHHE